MTEPSDRSTQADSAAPESADVGRLVDGRYRLAELIGVGGMATVHRALDTKLERPVAVKLLRREVVEDHDIAMRFRREALAATVLRHPNIIACLETGTDRGQPYLVMELIEGEDLAARLRRVGRMSPPTAARIGLDVARALGVAHVRGIVHRDVKPGNIVLARDGRAMVTDFGIARLAADAEGAVPGTTLGSVHYFSPEQATGSTTTPASDVYSLGLVLFESLTGQRAWSGDTTAALAAARIGSLAPSPRAIRPDVPVALDAIVVRALDSDPARRYPNGNALASALEPIVGRPDPLVSTVVVGSPAIAAATTGAPALPPPLVPAGAAVGSGFAMAALAAPPTAVRRGASPSSPAIAGPLAVLLIVGAVVAGALLVAARPGGDDLGAVAVASPTRTPRPTPTPRPTTRPAPTPAPTPDPDPTPNQAIAPTAVPAATPKPTPKPAPASVRQLCEPFFGFACGLDKSTYAPAAFTPAITFKLGDGWSVSAMSATLMSLARDDGVLTFASSIGTVYPNGAAAKAPGSVRGLIESFIGTDGVAAGKPKSQKYDKRAAIMVDLAPTGPDRIALFGTADKTFYLESFGTTRVFVIGTGDGPLVVAIEPVEDSTIEAIRKTADPVVKSIRFR